MSAQRCTYKDIYCSIVCVSQKSKGSDRGIKTPHSGLLCSYEKGVSYVFLGNNFKIYCYIEK